MATELKLPELAESMTSAAITAWLKQPGDRVTAGDPIVEVDTDKTTVEVEAPVSGVLREIVVAVGTAEVEVGGVLAVIDEDEDEAAADVSTAVETQPDVEPAARTPKVPPRDPDMPNPDRRLDVAAEPEVSSEVDVDGTPLARKMAAAARLDLTRVTGSGQAGRIEKSDVDRALGLTTQTEAAATSYTVPSLSAMRRVTAKRMVESKRTVPHFYLSAECDMTDVVDRRRGHNAEGHHVTITDIVVRAAALALQQVPAANSAWHDEGVRMFSASHVAVAVNTPGGLVAPVIRDADQKRLGAISSELRALSERARNGQLSPDEYAGGTFTISNLGMFEVTSLYAIVNPPQSCILGIGAVTSRPVVRDGAVTIGQVATLTLSADHRVLDGATGSELLREIRHRLESPPPLFD